MNRRFSLLSSAVLAGSMLLAPEAEARFGKRTDSEPAREAPRQESNDSGSSTHAASPVGSSAPERTPRAEERPRGRPVYQPRRYYAPPPPQPVYVTPAPVYVTPAPTYYAPAPAPVAVSGSSEEYRNSLHKNVLFGFDVQALRNGGGASLHLGLEGDRVGFNLRGGGLSLRADDGSGDRDSLGFFSSHLSYAVVTGERGRLRVEGGVSIIGAPDATFVGPSLGSSAEYYLFDVLSVEGRVHLTPVPHRQLDTAGGLAFYFFDNLFALRGGVRMLMLDDAGLVDGVVHREVLAGPYFSLGLAI